MGSRNDASSSPIVGKARTAAASLWRGALRAPVIRELREAGAVRSFRAAKSPGNHFFGVFRSLEEAQAAVPKNVSDTYDTEAGGELYRERVEAVFSHDYPVLFWLNPLVSSVHRVFDFGGHIGIANYAYERYLGSLAHLDWQVCDLPRVAAAGRELAALRGRRGLRFTTESADATGADVFLASGVLQYLPRGFLPDLLDRLHSPPKHILVNIMPATPRETFFTLNNIRTGICPYLVVNEQEFVTSIVERGYEHVDSWSAPGKTLHIPLRPEQTLDAYRGFYFRRLG